MPSFVCKHPPCNVILPARGYCPAHAATARPATQFYDQHLRDRDAKRFYNSAAWRRAREIKLGDVPWCEECNQAAAEHVHHKKPLQDCTPAERIAQDNLQSVCLPCHNAIEARVRAERK